jgi:mannan endo-1,4-beta-mannosidase
MKRTYYLLFILLFLFSCKSGKENKHSIPTVLQVKAFLHEIAGEKILFGHQDDLAYGIGWNALSGESDIKRLTGSYPAIFGWDIGNIGDQNNLDGVPFDSIRAYMIRAHLLGGINTVSWHSRNPLTGLDAWNMTGVNVSAMLPGGEFHSEFLFQLNLVADFFKGIKTESGEIVPLIFRPWHEMYGDWFWWGSSTCSNEEYIQLFRFTVDFLRKEKGLNNLLIAFSPNNSFETKEAYLTRYPGDGYVDVLGLDNYSDFDNNRLDLVVIKLGIVSDIAQEKGKIAAFTETGNDKLEIQNWYTSNLLQVLNASEKTRKISYVMVWRNCDTSHFYVPYKGHCQEEDFMFFVNNKLIFLLEELKN